MSPCRLTVAVIVASALCGRARSDDVRFNRDVRPILSENCFFCHGPDAGKREADLRLDDQVSATSAAIVPDDSDASELIARITSTDPDLVMPPPSSGRALSAAQIQTLRQWIDQGADYESHWSLMSPQRTLPPEDPSGWSKNEIDQFLLASMRSHELSPAPQTDRDTWLRRVSFDLIGLPPSLEELDAFANDQSPVAYERVVDRLLASPRYGERMAADWLDVSRYSDSYGMQVDRDRRVWPYRDWVIGAFNRGIGYDQFITEQVAGDLLPNATRDQILATTFNRLHPQECEGGSVPEEFRIESVADRTQTFATAFLGLTMECCRCHDHKYDPLSQHDYYALSGFFDNIDEAGLYSFFTDSCPTPTLELPSEEQSRDLEAAAAKVDELASALKHINDSRRAAFADWLKSQSVIAPVSPKPPLLARDFESIDSSAVKQVPGKIGNGIQLNGDDGLDLGVGNFERWQPFTISLWLQSPDVKDRSVVFHRSRAWTDAASRGYELLIDEGHLQASLIHFWPGNAVSVRTREPLAINSWVHVAVTWDGSSTAGGLVIFVNGSRADTEVVRDSLTKQISGGGGDEITIGARFRDRGFTNGSVDEFSVYDRQLTDLEIARLQQPDFVVDLLSEPDDTVRRQLFEYYLATVDAGSVSARDSLTAARRELFNREDLVPEIMVMRELTPRRQSYVLDRGAYNARSVPVSPATPAALPPLDDRLPRNRLSLAAWLVDADSTESRQNPLVARVAVNRLWQGVFGRGLVATPEDFGSQGRPPSHPQLLDWLAVDFRESGWNVKRFLRQLVLSNAYRQSSQSMESHDPENIYLARFPRYRLPAEMLRDNALAISGLLDSTIGGEPAKPYEVEASFKPVERDKGDGLYRRSVYTYWKRTGPAPLLTTLDASLRDVCRVKRDMTASPLQALVMFNSPQFVEASRVFAEKLVRAHGSDTATIAAVIFRTVTSRHASQEERQLLIDLHQRQKARFASNHEQSRNLLAVGDAPVDATLDPSDVAATTSLVISLLSYDHSLTKR